MKPDLKFLLAHPSHFVACGFGSGLSPYAPGTAGTLAAWLLYPLVRWPFGEVGFLIFLVLAFGAGVLACERTGKNIGVVDHGAIVWDEIVPFWLVLFMAPAGFAWQVLAFLLFRGFDIVKPEPARWIDGHVKNGLGVMSDDLIAAFYTVFTLAVLKQALDWW